MSEAVATCPAPFLFRYFRHRSSALVFTIGLTSAVKKMHPAGMDHFRIQEITAEMCDLLNEQTEWLKSPTGFLTDLSVKEVDGYKQRNDRLCQLGAELSELD
jgi:hypothetical protein